MRILVVAPHADDETIGMGGTIARLASRGHDIVVVVLTGHGEDEPHPIWPRSAWDTVRNELRESCSILGVREILFEEIPAAGVADQPIWKVNRITSDLIERAAPDILYVPFLNDLHKDHRELFHSFSVAWRCSSIAGRKIREIYSYEVASETHLNFPYVEQGFLPNVWVDITDFLEIKLAASKCYVSQLQEHPSLRSVEAIRALAIWRGSQIGVEAAEAFVLVRMIQR